ncbi:MULTISPECIES: right-handed parallel beta-helix repeat-containing protein [unclassified Pseudomonas]|uniref:right-handed parallel beta-helix repeat-containing protein n=1 Tax=unclassified Pseudomonas TaxID=196821 RepID=UPI001AE59162|nr:MULTISPECIES: right-handed parallel beta-helix repeat-containing protein [unclassified Pseudomonas]MBP2270135.1 parallel beta-helix repeat protein [Pseudomonas sp. BP6]MBP2285582.1 parallel beta-helix repeat protein [Pseudomonas sp. BP7]HDS1698424.1 right-handed parallel beta-helix repeat-containing protein [Pseudomonas putida]HDS1703604.1 right-handed parallel beta-helix repeat-containing protein [Pseudomonas putida]
MKGENTGRFMFRFALCCGFAGCMQAASAGEVNSVCELPGGGDINGDVKLDRKCTYNQTVNISTSNTKLDCDGATLDGMGKLKDGVSISSQGRQLRNVSVSNCNVKNFANNGVAVRSGVPDFKRSGSRDHNYNISPSGVALSHLHVENSGGVGVYLYSYVSNVTLRESVVEGSRGVGVYLEQSSRENKLINNIIKNNGDMDGPKSGQREGVAVDSSAKNLIEGNSFIDNSAGGIFLYKNCGENFSKGMAVLRWQSSNENVIRNNKFVGESVGVWIASRQGRDLSHRDCGDASLDGRGKFYRDYADHNTVENNKFCGGGEGVRVDGNFNMVRNNKSDVQGKYWVVQSKNMTTRLTGVPAEGNVVEGNRYESCN